MIIVEVVLRESSYQFDHKYTYLWQKDLGEVALGMEVSVPFGAKNQLREAFIFSWKELSQEAFNEHLKTNKFRYKTVNACLYPSPVLTAEQINLCEMMKIRYATTYATCIRCILPPGFNLPTGIKDKNELIVCLHDLDEASELLNSCKLRSMKQKRCIQSLIDYGSCEINELCQEASISKAVVRNLVSKGILETYIQERAALSPEISTEECEADKDLNVEQQVVLDNLLQAFKTSTDKGDERRIKEYLLYGVTGSGKTEIFLQLAKSLLADNKSCLILVPEIALTPQMQLRFTKRFGQQVAVMHSRLSRRERFEVWKSVKEAKTRLVVGARSAVFMPLQDLALVVIDEEHEGSYYSDRNPHYDARTIARLRVRDKNAILLLASATPSVESFKRTEEDKSKLLTLTKRAGEALSPDKFIVDMRRENLATSSSLSKKMLSAISETLEAKEQVLLFLNKRGYSSFMLCKDCGYKKYCPNCSSLMTHHKSKTNMGFLLCHYCDYTENVASICPSCKSKSYAPYGEGTQKLEEELTSIFPQARLLRMDRDSTSSKNAHKEILEQFALQKADILVGTQMIAKGHDISNITLVGILSADQLFFSGDFRSNERGFQLIAQASGRAGRGEKRGKVIIQSYNPDDVILNLAASDSYINFYKQELEARRTLLYPPVISMSHFTVSAVDDYTAKSHAKWIYTELEVLVAKQTSLSELRMSKPHKAEPYRLYGKCRYIFTLKHKNEAVLSYLMSFVAKLKQNKEIQVQFSLDPA